VPTTELKVPADSAAPGTSADAPGIGVDAPGIGVDAPGGDRLGPLWSRFREQRDETTRSALVTAYYPLVKHVARRVFSALSHHVEIGDLEGWGAVGLLDAIDRYEASRGAQFATFAVHRIRGAIYDGIRQVDWAPRSLRRREREIQSNFARLCGEHGREPTESEEAGALGVAVEILRSAKGQISNAHVASLESRVRDGRYGDGRDALEPSDPADEPLEACIARETSLALQAMLRSLDERERTVTALSFAEGLTLAEIGARLGVTESRVCQIRASAIRRLRAYARAQGLVPA
jgi:RNA polymerase sigma factor for flagellar operon FliA